MNLRSVRHGAAIALAFILLAAQTCDNSNISLIVTSHSATISVKNTASEVVFVLLYADDANAAGNLTAGQSANITTHIDGAYHVVVAASGLKLGNYQSSLSLLREATQDLYRSRGANEETKVSDAQTRIGTARQNLEGLFQTGLALASCVGTVWFKIDLTSPSPPPRLEIYAIVTESDGTWGAICPSAEQ